MFRYFHHICGIKEDVHVNSLEPGETPYYSPSNQTLNYVQRH